MRSAVDSQGPFLLWNRAGDANDIQSGDNPLRRDRPPQAFGEANGGANELLGTAKEPAIGPAETPSCPVLGSPGTSPGGAHLLSQGGETPGSGKGSPFGEKKEIIESCVGFFPTALRTGMRWNKQIVTCRNTSELNLGCGMPVGIRPLRAKLTRSNQPQEAQTTDGPRDGTINYAKYSGIVR